MHETSRIDRSLRRRLLAARLSRREYRVRSGDGELFRCKPAARASLAAACCAAEQETAAEQQRPGERGEPRLLAGERQRRDRTADGLLGAQDVAGRRRRRRRHGGERDGHEMTRRRRLGCPAPTRPPPEPTPPPFIAPITTPPPPSPSSHL